MSVLAVLKEIADRTNEMDTGYVAQVAKDPTPSSSLTIDHVASAFFTENERRGWKVLVVRQPEKPPTCPITVKPGLQIMDVARFTDATIRDLVTYVAAQNMGSYHWVDRMLDEKLELLKRCGVRAEIRPIQ